MTAPLTPIQARVLAFMQQFFLANDQVPSNEMIADHFGWGSANSAHCHVQSLAKRGLLERNSVGRWKFSAKARPGEIEVRGPAWLPLPVVDSAKVYHHGRRTARQESAHA
jgi:SOS-response transcriptional repressor LexA